MQGSKIVHELKKVIKNFPANKEVQDVAGILQKRNFQGRVQPQI
jgi:hypothetical protein